MGRIFPFIFTRQSVGLSKKKFSDQLLGGIYQNTNNANKYYFLYKHSYGIFDVLSLNESDTSVLCRHGCGHFVKISLTYGF